MQADMITVSGVAETLGIASDKVLSWIHMGELPAIDVSRRRGGRPRWRIRRADLESFLQRREHMPAEAAPKKTDPTAATKYF